MKFSQMLRLVWIDAHLGRGHALNRSDLVAAFAISEPQASNDIREYRSRWPRAIKYDLGGKFYYAGGGNPVFTQHQRDAVLAAQDAVLNARELVGRLVP